MIETTISSADNNVFKSLHDCLSSKGIKKHGQFLVFGERAVIDTLNLRTPLVRNLILKNEIPNYAHQSINSKISNLLQLLQKTAPNSHLLKLEKNLFSELDVFGTNSPILVLNTPEIKEISLQHEPQGLEILCALSDPSNLGALLRSAAAFSASKVILLRESASPFHPKAVRAASAATLSCHLFRGPAVSDITSASDPINLVALDMNGEDLRKFDWPKNVRLLLGEEGLGVPKIRPDLNSPFQKIAIPMAPNVESLNATVAASIAMYSYRSRHS